MLSVDKRLTSVVHYWQTGIPFNRQPYPSSAIPTIPIYHQPKHVFYSVYLTIWLCWQGEEVRISFYAVFTFIAVRKVKAMLPMSLLYLCGQPFLLFLLYCCTKTQMTGQKGLLWRYVFLNKRELQLKDWNALFLVLINKFNNYHFFKCIM